MSPASVSCLLSQKEMDKTKGQRDYEEKLIVSAWYNMVSGHVPAAGSVMAFID